MKQVGRAVHAFLAADPDSMADREGRTAMAERVLAAHEVTQVVDTDSLLKVSEALTAWVAERWPGARCWREWPVRWQVDTPGGRRLLVGEVDRVIETTDGSLIVLDHKSMARIDEGGFEARLPSFAGQLAAYRAVLEAATGRRVAALAVHLPVQAEVVFVDVERELFTTWLEAASVVDQDPA